MKIVTDLAKLEPVAVDSLIVAMYDQVGRHDDESRPLWQTILRALEAEKHRRTERPTDTAASKIDLPLEAMSTEGIKKFAMFGAHLELAYAELGLPWASGLWEMVSLVATEEYEARQQRPHLN